MRMVSGRLSLVSASGVAGEPRLFNTKQIEPRNPPERASVGAVSQVHTALCPRRKTLTNCIIWRTTPNVRSWRAPCKGGAFPAGVSPARQPLQPEATGAIVEV